MNNRIFFKNLSAVLVYIPKAACTSLRSFFLQASGGPVLSPRGITKYPFRKISLKKTRELQHQCQIFGVIRDPLTRLISCYQDKLRVGSYSRSRIQRDGDGEDYPKGLYRGFHKYKGVFYESMSFAEFVRAVSEISDSLADPHFASQTFLLSDAIGILPNNILQLEDPKLFPKLRAALGVQIATPKLRVSGMGCPIPEIPKEIQKLVNQRYQQDYKNFKYRKL